MKVIKQWKGKEALTIYKKEFDGSTPISEIAYIELLELPGANELGVYIVYGKEVKDKVA